MEKGDNWVKEQWIISISAALLIIGAVLSWVSSYLSFGGLVSMTRTISGLTTQIGYFTGGVGIVIFVMFFLKKTPKLTSIILGALTGIISLLYLYYIKFVPKGILELKGSPGIGLYLTIIASIGLVMGGFLAKKKNIQ